MNLINRLDTAEEISELEDRSEKRQPECSTETYKMYLEFYKERNERWDRGDIQRNSG